MSQRYTSYDDSGIAWLPSIPSHWSSERLATLFTQEAEAGDDELPVLSVSIHSGVTDTEIPEEEQHRQVVRSEDRSKYKRVRPGDLVYNMMRAWQGGFGTVAVDGAVSPAYVVARPSGANVLTSYVEALLRTPMAVEEMRRNSRGVTDFRLRLYWEQFRQMRIPVPPLAEQQAIAAFLDRDTAKLDALVKEQRRLIALLKEKRQAVISHAVTRGLDPTAPLKPSGIDSLGDIPAHWEVGPLKRHWTVTDCKHLTAPFVDDGFALASIREVQSKFVKLDEAKFTTEEYFVSLCEGDRQPRAGDLIFSRNATVGEVAQVADWHPPFAMGQDVCLLRRRENTSSADFLQSALRSSFVKEQLELLMVGATFKRVNVEAIRNLVIAFPPAGEQAEISDQLLVEEERFNALTAEATRAIALLQERRAALISAAVTGKIDVRGSSLEEEAA